MNGAIADPAVRTISTPKVSKTTISGTNQNFFLTRRKPQRSLMNSIINVPFYNDSSTLIILKNENIIIDHRKNFLPKPNQQAEANCLQQLHLPMVINGPNQ